MCKNMYNKLYITNKSLGYHECKGELCTTVEQIWE